MTFKKLALNVSKRPNKHTETFINYIQIFLLRPFTENVQKVDIFGRFSEHLNTIEI